MKNMLGVVLGAVLLGGFAGCVSHATPPVDRRVTIAEDLGMDLVITDVRCAKGASPYCTFQANAVNLTRGDLGVEWKVVWLDANGMAIDSVVSSEWNRVVLSAKDIQALKATAPRVDAVDMRFHVRAIR